MRRAIMYIRQSSESQSNEATDESILTIMQSIERLHRHNLSERIKRGLRLKKLSEGKQKRLTNVAK